MKNFDAVTENLRSLGYTVSCFDTAAQAARYLDSRIDGTTVGFGGSVTLEQLGLYELLSAHNRVFWHWRPAPGEDLRALRARANAAAVYLTSANGMAETGEIVNIDGTGNRVASSFYGHEKVYIVAGENKLAADYDAALYRARNVAAPLNARRLGAKTPCAEKGDRCYDCKSPGRICRELAVFWRAPLGGDYEVVLIHEDLGY